MNKLNLELFFLIISLNFELTNLKVDLFIPSPKSSAHCFTFFENINFHFYKA